MTQSTGEFALIDNYFKDLTGQSGVVVGIGDDAAVIAADALSQMAVATDTLVESVHFPQWAEAKQIATRALCVNLSDMAAMGAEPKWFTLALTLPVETASDAWLRGFSAGLAQIAAQHNIALIGGDTTAGPLTISITLLGELPKGRGLYRNGAKSGDMIYVSGTLGDGAAALEGLVTNPQGVLGQNKRLLEHFYCPVPQLELGLGLCDFASACIDISDGLVADLGHLCEASQVSAQIYSQQLPIHPELKQLSKQQYLQWALSGGDDYQLCFTLPEAQQRAFEGWAASNKIPVTAIGKMVPLDHNQNYIRVDNQSVSVITGGYNHFGQ
ncbi:MAG: thiamine-phosphate kinase [Porticoccaceae bacterium]|nr:thiamine-phosphate kinase [Porticoccaceae bacterium]